MPGLRRLAILIAIATPLIATRVGAGTLSVSPSPVLPTGYTDVYANAMTAGPDGNVWLVDRRKNRVGRLTVVVDSHGFSTATFTPFAVPTANTTLQGITAGADGNIWFTEGKSIGRITTQGAITEFPVSTSSQLGPITSGPDGALWFIDGGFFSGTTKLGRIAVDGTIAEFNVAPMNAYIQDLITGADGNLWFVDGNGMLLYKVSTTGTVVATYPINAHGQVQVNSRHIILGPDGNVWFPDVNSIDRATPQGIITDYPVPTPNAFPAGLAIGSDGNLWFSENGTGQIGQLIISSATASGQATINESNLPISFAILQADQLFPVPVPGNDIRASDILTPPCAPIAYMLNSSQSGSGSNLATVTTVENPSTCADLRVRVYSWGRGSINSDVEQRVGFTVNIKNLGPNPSQDVSVKLVAVADVPSGINVIVSAGDPSHPTTPNYDGTTATFSVPSLPPLGTTGGIVEFVSHDPLHPIGAVSLTASAFASTPDQNPFNNIRSNLWSLDKSVPVLPAPEPGIVLPPGLRGK